MKAHVVMLGCIAVMAAIFASCAKKATNDYWPAKEWRTTEPGKVRMDAKGLEEIDAYVRSTRLDVSSVLVVRHGYIVFERYYHGGSDTLRSINQETPSVLSALIGVAIEQGLIESVDQPMIDFFPENEIIRSDPLVDKITIRHLLTMSDGIITAGNMIEFYFSDPKLSKKLKTDPGSRFRHNGISPYILSMILRKATGLKSLDFGRKHLFEPLGITNVVWHELKGDSRGLYGLMLTTRDMAKIGYLYLKKGIWNNEQVIPQEWVSESTRSQIATGESSAYRKDYGYCWWIYTFGAYPGYFAFGWRGQLICVVPELDLVAVLTTHAFGTEGGERPYFTIAEKYILGSVKK